MTAGQARAISDANNPLKKRMQAVFDKIEEAAYTGATSVTLGHGDYPDGAEDELRRNSYTIEYHTIRGEERMVVSW